MEQKDFIVAGIDVGAATAKTVILNGRAVQSSALLPTGASVTRSAEAVMEEALKRSGLTMERLGYVVSTGYGRRAVPFAHKALTEILCHARGVNTLHPGVRTVIDIGGQDSKAIAVDEKGHVSNFVMNDKCAAGTGRFLEVMAMILEVKIQEIGVLSLDAREPCKVTSTCTIFAESEMVSLRAEGRSQEDILAGIHHAMAHRIAIMGKTVGFRKEVVFTGGVAKNPGMKKALEEAIQMEILVPEEPQMMGALGAAIYAQEEFRRIHSASSESRKEKE